MRIALLDSFPGADLVTETRAEPPTARSSVDERRAVYVQSGLLRTEARLSLLDDGWYVLFRASSLAGFDEEATSAIDLLAKGIGWE